MGRVTTFQAMSTKASLLAKLNKQDEANKIMQAALPTANVMEMHIYGRQLLTEKRLKEAMEIFQTNFKKNKGIWPTNGGLMRGYSAIGDFKKALEHAKLALAQAPNEPSKNFIEQAIKTLESGKPL